VCLCGAASRAAGRLTKLRSVRKRMMIPRTSGPLRSAGPNVRLVLIVQTYDRSHPAFIRPFRRCFGTRPARELDWAYFGGPTDSSRSEGKRAEFEPTAAENRQAMERNQVRGEDELRILASARWCDCSCRTVFWIILQKHCRAGSLLAGTVACYQVLGAKIAPPVSAIEKRRSRRVPFPLDERVPVALALRSHSPVCHESRTLEATALGSARKRAQPRAQLQEPSGYAHLYVMPHLPRRAGRAASLCRAIPSSGQFAALTSSRSYSNTTV